MQFHIDVDQPEVIAGWLLPDNPAATSTLAISCSGIARITMSANVLRPDVKASGHHSTGQVGFSINETIVPELSSRNDLEIRDSDSGLLIYRRTAGVQRKILCLNFATAAPEPFAAQLKDHFTLYYDAVERHPYDTLFALLNNQSAQAASLLVAGRPSLLRYESILHTNGFTLLALLRSPCEDLGARLLAARDDGAGAPLAAAAAVALDEGPALDEVLERSLETNPGLRDPMVRALAATPEDRLEQRHVSVALNTLSTFELVGTRARLADFRADLAEILGRDVLGDFAPGHSPELTALAGRLVAMPAVQKMLSLDLSLYDHVEQALARALDPA